MRASKLLGAAGGLRAAAGFERACVVLVLDYWLPGQFPHPHRCTIRWGTCVETDAPPRS